MTLSWRHNPQGTSTKGPWRDTTRVQFLADLTTTEESGVRHYDQQIFDQLFDLVRNAETFLVLDFFLINDFAGDPETAPRRLSGELIDAIAEVKAARPELAVLLVTDPINRVYGSETHDGFDRLRVAGVAVVETDLAALRDSNPAYSAVYRWLFRWFGNDVGGGFLPNPFLPGDETTLRSYLSLLNFKANHRKVAVAGHLAKPALALVTSANPHDASSGHSNVALLVEGEVALDLAESELAVAEFSGWRGRQDFPLPRRSARRDQESDSGRDATTTGRGTDSPNATLGGHALPNEGVRVRMLSESAIRDAIENAVRATGEGSRVDVAMFYLGHRGIVEALLAAAERGARVRLILDANRDAFGRTKDGVPNRPAANELVTRSRTESERGHGLPIEVRWYRTGGEQFHTKMVVIDDARNIRLILGSANLTRRNLDDFNLETDLEVEMASGSLLGQQLESYFNRLWSNDEDRLFTDDYQRFADESRWARWRYRVMEATGLSTF